MDVPALYHDPTSEPSRAVHWFTLEAGVEVTISSVWLTRGEHRAPAFQSINPAHQVPALEHAGFCLSEASAIMLYLAEIAGVRDLWVGASAGGRAQTQRFLSWHHTNTRLKVTLDYFLPVLLKPAYTGASPPSDERVRQLRERGREPLTLLEGFLVGRGSFLGGRTPSVADLFIASDLYALDADPMKGSWFYGLPRVSGWLDRLRDRNGYRISHAAWNAIVPRIQQLVSLEARGSRNPRWVADACGPYLP